MKKFIILLLALVPAFVLAQSVCTSHLLPACNACSTSGSAVNKATVIAKGEARIAADHSCKINSGGPPAIFCDLTGGEFEEVVVKFHTQDNCWFKHYRVSALVQAVDINGTVTYAQESSTYVGSQATLIYNEGLECGNTTMQ